MRKVIFTEEQIKSIIGEDTFNYLPNDGTEDTSINPEGIPQNLGQIDADGGEENISVPEDVKMAPSVPYGFGSRRCNMAGAVFEGAKAYQRNKGKMPFGNAIQRAKWQRELESGNVNPKHVKSVKNRINGNSTTLADRRLSERNKDDNFFNNSTNNASFKRTLNQKGKKGGKSTTPTPISTTFTEVSNKNY